jgi:hypothetical protein
LILDFDPDTHTYRVDDWVLPSVTDVIKGSGLMKGLHHVDPAVLQKAQAVGTEVHAVIHRTSLGEPPGKVSSEAQPFVDGWMRFLHDTGYKSEHSELHLYCEDHWFAGTIDQVGPINRQRAIIDMKATSGFNTPHVAWQTAAYQHLYNTSYPDKPATRRYGLHLKHHTYSLWPFKSPLDIARFLIARKRLG